MSEDFLYRAAEKDITPKSLWHKGFRRFLMHFSLLLRDLNKTTGILLSAKKDITLFSRQFAPPCIMVVRKLSLFISYSLRQQSIGFSKILVKRFPCCT